MIWEALNFALEKHSKQVDIHGLDYRLHILRVMAGLSRSGVNKPEALAAAALHDVVEDCGVTLEEIKDKFGPEVTELVHLMTHNPAYSYTEYIERLDANRVARAIKLADLEDNSLAWRTVPGGRKQAELYPKAIYRLQTGEWPK